MRNSNILKVVVARSCNARNAVFFCCMLMASAVLAKTVYVDDDNYNEAYETYEDYKAAGFDGTTEAKAYGTIQMGVDGAAANDTILVLPGTYDKGERNLSYTSGGVTTDCGACRVVGTQSYLTIKSRDGAAVTHIVGKKAATEKGYGPGAVRCFGQYWKTGIQLRGFTLRDGATDSNVSSDLPTTRGAAVFTVVVGGDCPTYVIDCVVSNCYGQRGITQNGTVFRTLFCDNFGSEGVGRQTQFYSCVFTRNQMASGSVFSSSKSIAINCTAVDNVTGYAANGVTGIYNSILGLSHNIKNSNAEINGSPTVGGNVTQTANGIYQTVAPMLGDFRVLKGADAEIAGDPQYLDAKMFTDSGKTFFPEGELNKDFFGHPIWDGQSATVRAGAINESVEPAGGAIQFDSLIFSGTRKVEVEGLVHQMSGIYAYPTNCPVMWKNRPITASSSERFYSWSVPSEHGYNRFGDVADDASYVMPPLDPSVVVTNTFAVTLTNMANVIVWLDPTNGSDDTGDGSKVNPYQTLQKGFDVVSTSGFSGIIYCKKGVYDKGETESIGRKNRLVGSTGVGLFIAVDGPDVTFIEGKSDPNGTVESQPGCGDNAVAGVSISGNPNICFHGFTFRKCYTPSRTGGVEAKHKGAVCSSGSFSVKFMDCVFDGNVGAGTLLNSATAIRCVFRNNTASELSNGPMFGCFAENNALSGTDGSAYNCTFRKSKMAKQNFCTVAKDGSDVTTDRTYAGCLFWNFASVASTAKGFTYADPMFARATGGDVIARSPAFTCGVVPTTENAGKDAYKWATYLFGGKPMPVTDGHPVAGAYPDGIVAAAYVSADQGGLSRTTGGEAFDGSDTLVIAPGEGTRPCIGFTANGTTNLFADVSSTYTFTKAEATAAGSLVLQAIYTKDWYVSPTGSDDTGTGSFPAAAFLTLTNAMAHAVAGDTVKALPGTYDEGGEVHGADWVIRSRVVVKSDVTLESTDGPENTIIRGAAATEPDAIGCGADAIRCAYVKNRGVISGFTLTGGHTKGKADGQHYRDDWSAGGVLGQSESATVRNCIIRQNSAFRGGGARYILMDTCQVIDNTAGANSPAVGESKCVNTLFKDNWGWPSCYACTLYDCTFRGCWSDEAKTQTTHAFYADIGASDDKTSVRWANIAIENGNARYHAFEGVECTLFRNVYATGLSNLPTGTTGIQGVTKVTVAELALGVDDRPIAGKSCIVDKSDLDYASPQSAYLTDAAGGQRVYNGARDVGAMEADWRSVYTTDIGLGFKVNMATANVTESDNHTVLVQMGEWISATLAKAPATYVFTFIVPENGSAVLDVAGTKSTYTAGTQTVRIDSVEPDTAVTLASVAGTAEIVSCRRDSGLLLIVR